MSLEEAIRNGINESLKERFKERRGKLDIMADILSVTAKGAKKTEMVYKANLNFTRLGRYISFLEERGLLENSGAEYRATKKGEEFLRDYQKIHENLLI